MEIYGLALDETQETATHLAAVWSQNPTVEAYGSVAGFLGQPDTAKWGAIALAADEVVQPIMIPKPPPDGVSMLQLESRFRDPETSQMVPETVWRFVVFPADAAGEA